MSMNEPIAGLEEQLKDLFVVAEHPPKLRTWKLEQLAREREQKRLLMALSLLSFVWTLLSFVLAFWIMEKDRLLGENMLIMLSLGLFSAGLLSAAILHTEQFSK